MTGPLWDALAGQLDNPFVLFFILIALSSAAVSKRFERFSGPLGALARRFSRRQIARVERQRELWEATHKADRARESARRAAARQRDNVRIEQMEAELKWLEREITDMRRRDRHRDQLARLHGVWDNHLITLLQAAGIDVPDPPPLYLDLAPLYDPKEPPT